MALKTSNLLTFFLVQAKQTNRKNILYRLYEGNIALIGNALAMDLSGWLIDQSDAQELNRITFEDQIRPDKFIKDECEEEWYLEDTPL